MTEHELNKRSAELMGFGVGARAGNGVFVDVIRENGFISPLDHCIWSPCTDIVQAKMLQGEFEKEKVDYSIDFLHCTTSGKPLYCFSFVINQIFKKRFWGNTECLAITKAYVEWKEGIK